MRVPSDALPDYQTNPSDASSSVESQVIYTPTQSVAEGPAPEPHCEAPKPTFIHTLKIFLTPLNTLIRNTHGSTDAQKKIAHRYNLLVHIAYLANLLGWGIFTGATMVARPNSRGSFVTLTGGQFPHETLWIGWGEACTSGGSCATWTFLQLGFTPPPAWTPQLSMFSSYIILIMDARPAIAVVSFVFCFICHFRYSRMSREAKIHSLSRTNHFRIFRFLLCLFRINKLPRLGSLPRWAVRRDTIGAHYALLLAKVCAIGTWGWEFLTKDTAGGSMMHISDAAVPTLLVIWVAASAYASHIGRSLEGPWASPDPDREVPAESQLVKENESI